MKLKLRQLPPVDLSDQFALILENGMIKHYKIFVGAQTILESLGASKTPQDLVIDHIRYEMNRPDLEIEVLPMSTATSPEVFKTVEALARESFNCLLTDKTKKNVDQTRVTSLLHQYNERIWWSGLLAYTPLKAILQSKIVQGLSNSIREFCISKVEKVGHDDWELTYRSRAHEILLNAFANSMLFLRILSESTEVRKVTPCRFLAIACQEDELDQAITQLADEVNILDKEMQIMGNLLPFGIIELANTIGNDGKVYAVFSYLFTKGKRRHEKMNETDLLTYLQSHGIKSMVREGGIALLNGKKPYQHLLLAERNVDWKSAINGDVKVEMK